MSGKSVKVYIAFLYVKSLMHNALRAIDKNRNPVRMRNSDNLAQGIDQTENVGDLSNCQNLSLRSDQSFQFRNLKMSRIINRKNLQGSTSPLAQELPGNNVRMMLSFRHNYFIATLHECLPKGIGDKIDGTGSTGCENNLSPVLSIEKFPDGIAGSLIFIRSFGSKEMYCTMDIGIVAGRHQRKLVENLDRPLGSRCIVEINQLLAIYFLRKGRK